LYRRNEPGDPQRNEAGPEDPELPQPHRTPRQDTPDQSLWVAIRNRTAALSFERYKKFIGNVIRRGSHPDQPSEAPHTSGGAKKPPQA
jgi:hypothetical protein